MKSGIKLIAEERQEQIEKHGRTIELDVKSNTEDQLLSAANAMINITDGEDSGLNHCFFDLIPKGWDKNIWVKMCSKAQIERLIIAGALIAAEIDRLQYEDK